MPVRASEMANKGKEQKRGGRREEERNAREKKKREARSCRKCGENSKEIERIPLFRTVAKSKSL